MAKEIYDQLAELLKEMHARFPNDAFKNRRRLKGLLEDHIEGAHREIRILLDAIDEGVVDTLRESAATELGMQIDRLIKRLENSRGMREDVARKVIQACAFSIGVGGLPSSVAGVGPANEQQKQQDSEDWVGLSDVVDPVRKPDPVAPNNAPPSEFKKKKSLWIAVAAAIGFYTFIQLKPIDSTGPDPQPPPGTEKDMNRLGGVWKWNWYDAGSQRQKWCHVAYDVVGNFEVREGCPDFMKNGKGTIRLVNGRYTTTSGNVVVYGQYQFLNKNLLKMIGDDGVITYWDRVR